MESLNTNAINDKISDNKDEKEESIKLLNNSIDFLSGAEYQFLLNLIEHNELQAFKKNYWHFVKRRKLNTLIDNDILDVDHTVLDDSLDYKKRIKKLTSEINRIQNNLSDYISRLRDVEEANSTLTIQNKSLENAIAEKENSIQKTLSRIKNLQSVNADLQSKVQQERIDEKIPNYVNNVKSELGSDDSHFIKMSIVWAIGGVVFGVSAVSMSIYTLFLKIDFNNIQLAELFYIFSRGIIGITILSWLSYICLNNSKRYTHESIRRKDRRHALMFGQVYLQIYGATASKEDAILVFKDWNMSGDSAFSDHTEQPPNVLSVLSNVKDNLRTTSEAKESN